MTEPMARPRTATWVKVLLALSLAMNLLVLGIVAGAFVKAGPGAGGLPRDLAFGPFGVALSQEDRRALRSAFMERALDLRGERSAAQAEFAALVATVRARPFDQAAVETALAAIEARYADRLRLGRELIQGRIAEMTPEQRLAFADRLENSLKRRGRPNP